MKHLTLIVHTDIQQDVIEQIRNLEQISGFSYIPVEGHGIEVESDPFLMARDTAVGHTARTRIDILLEDENVEFVLNSLRDSNPDIKGHSIYWVTNIEQSGRF
jgi:nitrogen regulatory protein P-II 1